MKIIEYFQRRPAPVFYQTDTKLIQYAAGRGGDIWYSSVRQEKKTKKTNENPIRMDDGKSKPKPKKEHRRKQKTDSKRWKLTNTKKL